MSGADYKTHSDGEITSEVHEYFTGDVYENEHTMVDDNAYRFEATEKKFRSGVVLISTKDALIGNVTNQRYPKSAGSAMSIDFTDLSQLYFKNAAAGQNTKINIVGVLL